MTGFDELPKDWWEQLKAIYPRRAGDQGWMAVRTLVPRRITEGHEWSAILAGTRAYAAHCKQKGQTGTEYVKQARTFYGPDCWFSEWADMDTRSPEQLEKELKWAGLEERAKALGFTTVDRSRGFDIAEYAIKREEDKRASSVVANLAKLKVVS